MNITLRQQAYLDSMDPVTQARGFSFGQCPGCPQCMDAAGISDEATHREAWERGELPEEESFSYSGCGICGSPLGGDHSVYHWIDSDNEICHKDDGCRDCLFFTANGDLPDDEHLEWTGQPKDTEAI